MSPSATPSRMKIRQGCNHEHSARGEKGTQSPFRAAWFWSNESVTDIFKRGNTVYQRYTAWDGEEASPRFSALRDDNCRMEWSELATESRILTRSFYNRDAVTVAQELLGKILVHRRVAGMIVETEAYLGGDDLAAHSARGITDRTRVIFGPPGHAYVYFIYGMHECLNLVAEPEGSPGCVLIRAAEPVAGIEIMKTRRPKARSMEKLASGPGNLTRAFAITRAQNGADVTRGPLVVRKWSREPKFEIQVTPRIGIRHCADWPLRFVIAGNKAVSG